MVMAINYRLAQNHLFKDQW